MVGHLELGPPHDPDRSPTAGGRFLSQSSCDDHLPVSLPRQQNASMGVQAAAQQRLALCKTLLAMVLPYVPVRMAQHAGSLSIQVQASSVMATLS